MPKTVRRKTTRKRVKHGDSYDRALKGEKVAYRRMLRKRAARARKK